MVSHKIAARRSGQAIMIDEYVCCLKHAGCGFLSPFQMDSCRSLRVSRLGCCRLAHCLLTVAMRQLSASRQFRTLANGKVAVILRRGCFSATDIDIYKRL